jgi:apolipoprotein N-acyltransferase
MEQKPDLVAWSETAFVPNISRWSREDPKQYQLAVLVREFLAYQRSLGTWLLTGNDDYKLVKDRSGGESRLDYNAAVLFSAEGERVETYHKVRLVPFTETFPYKKQLPWVYKLLLDFDVTFWEPGEERSVFTHPRFFFATPICFEDVFPGDVRRFVLNGAEVILNLSNDYWSLTEVEAMQHFVGSLFRAVENRRPLLRSTASGYTAYVDPSGRLVKGLPFYEEGYLVVDVPLRDRGTTLYTRYGDWFPLACVLGLLFLLVHAIVTRSR